MNTDWQDLFYRINTVEIHIPPLRERGEDIQLLADHFLRTYARNTKRHTGKSARDARGKLQRYAWPGNVRELQHAIERAVVLCNADTSMPTTSCCTPRHRPWPMERHSTWKRWNATPWRKPSACAKAT